jgi:DNA-binding LytR/AlgR family response regulator
MHRPTKELAGPPGGSRFGQMHRGTIVAVAHVDTTARDPSGRATLTTKTRPETDLDSRACAHMLRQV